MRDCRAECWPMLRARQPRGQVPVSADQRLLDSWRYFTSRLSLPKHKHTNLAPLLYATAIGQQPDWQIHANWCANVDDGSSHRVYMSTRHNSDQYDSVLACQRDAAQNNGDGGRAVAAVETARRQQVKDYMEHNKPQECISSYRR